MENKSDIQDIRIAGAGNISAGEYGNVKIAGAGEVLGTIKAENVSVSGTGEFHGDINSKLVKASGTLECYGSMNVEGLLKVNGSGEIKENLKGKEIVVNGSCEVGGNVSFEKMISRGGCEIKGDCEGEEFSSLGYISIDGLLAADKISIIPEGNSYIKEIGGEEITIKAEKKTKIMFFKISIGSDGVLNCDTIEGDKIYLENTQCKIVRGGDITIGKGCKIEKVEYTGEINITDKKSTVGEKVCMKI
ncbi:hypothetical protein [Clostridium sp. B9]|uniref:hypothetical protein n=1 Tax=Clostridium sp. B9 TaxID=3423224 RepID=UPI003D2EE78C